jgi:hypothetical protein
MKMAVPPWIIKAPGLSEWTLSTKADLDLRLSGLHQLSESMRHPDNTLKHAGHLQQNRAFR